MTKLTEFYQMPPYMTKEQFANLQANIILLSADPLSYIGNKPKPRETKRHDRTR